MFDDVYEDLLEIVKRIVIEVGEVVFIVYDKGEFDVY